MSNTEAAPLLDARFSSPGAAPRAWSEARATLDKAEIYWLSTVRADGRPHVTPVAAVWIDEALVFGTGPTEQKARNLGANPNCILTTGTNRFDEGFDVVVEGEAVRLADPDVLRSVCATIDGKYSGTFKWSVGDDGAVRERGGNEVHLFRVVPIKAFGFGRGVDGFSQTRWRFVER